MHAPPATLDERDFFDALRDQDGFLDITPADARRLFLAALRHAEKKIETGLPVARIMTQPAFALDAGLTLPRAAALLAERGVSGAPVTENGLVIGVVSVKDFLARLRFDASATIVALAAAILQGRACTAEPLQNVRLADVMSAPAVTVAPQTPAVTAARLLDARGINRLPVLTAGRLVGVVTRTDLSRALGGLAQLADLAGERP